jgi:OmpA-OmpF porin, OOP family
MYRWLVAAIALALAGGAQAQWLSHVYVGGGVGPSKFAYDQESLPIVNSTASTFSVDDDKSTAFKIYGGWRVNPFFAAEIGIVDFGSFTATRTLAAPSAGTARSEISVAGLTLDAVGIAPLGGSAELFAKLGAFVWGESSKRSTTGSVVIGTSSSSSTDDSAGGTSLHAAAGVNIRITSKVWARIEYERAFSVGDKVLGEGDVSAFTIGAMYRF